MSKRQETNFHTLSPQPQAPRYNHDDYVNQRSTSQKMATKSTKVISSSQNCEQGRMKAR